MNQIQIKLNIQQLDCSRTISLKAVSGV